MQDTDRRRALKRRVRELEREGFEPFTASGFDAKLYRDYKRSPVRLLHALRFYLMVLLFFLQPRRRRRQEMGRALVWARRRAKAHTLMVEVSVDEECSVREKRVFFT